MNVTFAAKAVILVSLIFEISTFFFSPSIDLFSSWGVEK